MGLLHFGERRKSGAVAASIHIFQALGRVEARAQHEGVVRDLVAVGHLHPVIGARIPVGFGQARGAAQHFNVVIHGQVGHALRIARGVAGRSGHGAGDAVFLNLVDVKAARLKAHAACFAQHIDAGGAAHGAGHAGNALLAQHGLAHHGDGLRRLPASTAPCPWWLAWPKP